MAKTELFPPVEGTNMSVSFGHIFGGGYAAGTTVINGLKYLMLMLSNISKRQGYLTVKLHHPSERISSKKEDQTNR